ncbi:hypothetical protein C2E23DRAFT_227194 [Lenzites betulinus]|nr:hypothetical protein C2E23DRAFT_227194 [Lenzites betulinus]
MESCPLPIEVCEFVIDAIVSLYARQPWLRTPRIGDALRNCALTCRAWRPRAQRRLWEVVRLDAFSVNKFVAKIRHVPARLASLVHTLEIYLEEGDPICRLNELLLASTIPGLHTLELHYRPYGFSRPAGLNLKLIHPKVLRTRPPLLAHVTSLKLSRCCFASLRAMFDVIWACPSLSSLKLEASSRTFKFGTASATSPRMLCGFCSRLPSTLEGVASSRNLPLISATATSSISASNVHI